MDSTQKRTTGITNDVVAIVLVVYIAVLLNCTGCLLAPTTALGLIALGGLIVAVIVLSRRRLMLRRLHVKPALLSEPASDDSQYLRPSAHRPL